MGRSIAQLEDILHVIVDTRTTRRGRPVLVAIDGRGGSGKSTVAATIAEQLPGAIVLHTDDFAFGWSGGWDWKRFQAQVLRPVLAGLPATYQRYDWNTDQLAEWHDVPAATQTLILEGVSSTRLDLGDAWDVTVWVEAPRQVRLTRGLERDGESSRHLWDQWMAAEEEWIAATCPMDRCDFVVDGSSSPPRPCP